MKYPVIWKHPKHCAHFLAFMVLFCCTIDASPGWFVQAVTEISVRLKPTSPIAAVPRYSTAQQSPILELRMEKRARATIIERIIERQKNRECKWNININFVEKCVNLRSLIFCRGTALDQHDWNNKNDGQTNYSVLIFFSVSKTIPSWLYVLVQCVI